ncbi:MAG TPA: histidine kinase dimerization/phosphoacceptor domain -containing protein, partial [Spirochaetia bacterium]|nr:histidine kinase dimerization/phosphoacceptor domain -containing protein [Spirochaetia bacterium]
CGLSLRAIGEFAAGLSREYSNDFELRITDELGLFIYNTDPVKIRQRDVQNSFERIRTPNAGPFSLPLDDGGRSYLVSGVATTHPHWYILVFTPVRLAYAPLGGLYLVLGLVLLASAVAGIVYSRLHLRRIVRGFNSLEAGTRRLADGEFAELVGFGEEFVELEKLGESFNVMVARLQKRDAHLREQEEQLSASLREKEVLLKEVHHRVKNNLQLISSFLSLEAMKRDYTGADSPFLQAQQRVRSLALIHESLYDSDLFDRVDFGLYAARLAREIFAQSLDGEVSIVTRLSDVTLTMEKAIPCGMILNEALTNTAKHAFPPGWDGPREIDLRIDRLDSGSARVVLKDSGAGLPGGYDPSAAHSLGHTIMQLLTKQLGGTLSIRSDAGTTVTLTFEG